MPALDPTVVLATHPSPTFVVDETGKVTAWNPAMAALTGKSAHEVVGQKAWKGFASKRIPLPLDEAMGDASSVSVPWVTS